MTSSVYNFYSFLSPSVCDSLTAAGLWFLDSSSVYFCWTIVCHETGYTPLYFLCCANLSTNEPGYKYQVCLFWRANCMKAWIVDDTCQFLQASRLRLKSCQSCLVCSGNVLLHICNTFQFWSCKVTHGLKTFNLCCLVVIVPMFVRWDHGETPRECWKHLLFWDTDTVLLICLLVFVTLHLNQAKFFICSVVFWFYIIHFLDCFFYLHAVLPRIGIDAHNFDISSLSCEAICKTMSPLTCDYGQMLQKKLRQPSRK